MKNAPDNKYLVLKSWGFMDCCHVVDFIKVECFPSAIRVSNGKVSMFTTLLHLPVLLFMPVTSFAACLCSPSAESLINGT